MEEQFYTDVNNPVLFSTGTVYDAHYRSGWQEDAVADEMMDYLINSMCEGMTCLDGKGNKDHKLANYSIEYLVDNLPAVNFVVTFYTQLIIGAGLKAKDNYNQGKLDEWLLKKNSLGQTNKDIIADSVKNSLMYGYSGIRLSLGQFYPVLPNNFKIWKLPHTVDINGRIVPVPGIKEVAFYEVNNRKDFRVEKDDKHNVFVVGKNKYTLEQVIRDKMLKKGIDGSYYFDDGENGAVAEQIFIEPDHFCHLRNSDDGDYGRSPLSYDKLRTHLLVDLLKNFRDEILNDGSDYIMYLKARNNAGASLTSVLSSEAANASITGAMDKKMVKTTEQKALESAKRLASKMKKSAKTRITIAPHDTIDDITKLEGTVRLPDYLGIYNDAKDVVADIYGIHSLLVGGKSSGWNTGMSSMLEFTMDKTIKPFQQRYSNQLSDYICDAAGLKGHVYFNEYNLLDQKAVADIEKIRAEVEEKTANAAKVAKETRLMTKQTTQNPSQPKSK